MSTYCFRERFLISKENDNQSKNNQTSNICLKSIDYIKNNMKLKKNIKLFKQDVMETAKNSLIHNCYKTNTCYKTNKKKLISGSCLSRGIAIGAGPCKINVSLQRKSGKLLDQIL